jgi:D-sedoheptulose 7-phosphate isomerase
VAHEQRGAAVAPIPVPSPGLLYLDAVASTLTARRQALDTAIGQLHSRCGSIAAIAACLIQTLTSGHKVLVAGNGGSAAEAQHFAAELVGRFMRERAPYAVLSLTSDSAILTAVGNDYGYGQVFARQVRGLGQPGDLFLAFSTSGDSENLIQAVEAARERRMTVVALTGARPNRLERAADLNLRVPIDGTPATQELHMLLTHLLCDVVEAELAARERELV